jgi:sulfate adenylyltransferase subunit 2
MSKSNSLYLKQLESESIYIIREAVATSSNPAMLYSIGKDSSVMLHLAIKAFYPAVPPFPLVHVDTLWKFKEMIEFRDNRAKEIGMELIIHSNPKGEQMNISPFEHGSKLHTDIMKTEALRQVLDKYNFDMIFGGARRDEEASRAKERIFSHRDKNHSWNPKYQRPEPFNIFNTNINKGESFRVFPLSNWTEKDIWAYIQQENIPIVPLYYAKEREVFEYDGMKILADDERVPKEYKNKIKKELVRFRTLGCYPLTGAISSDANTLDKVVDEMNSATTSERSGRAIDKDQTGSMEKKKLQGYF